MDAYAPRSEGVKVRGNPAFGAFAAVVPGMIVAE